MSATRAKLWKYAGTLPIVAVAACGVPIDDTPREVGYQVPPRFAAALEDSAGEVAPRFWESLGSTRLTALVEAALSNNRDLQATASRLLAATANAEIAGADLWPQLGVNGDGSRGRQNFVGLPIPGGDDVLSTTVRNLGISLDLSWEIDLWGRIRAGELAAYADVEAAAADYRAAQLSLAAQTARVWFGLVEASQQLRLARTTASNYDRTTDRVRERFQRGVRSSLDLRLTLSDRARAHAAVQIWREQLDAFGRELQVLVGRYPSGMDELGIELPNLDDPVPAGLPAELLTRRPDIIAAERQLAAADARLAEATAALYPRISLTASGGTRSTDFEDLADIDFRVWSLAANLLAPIFQGGRLRARVSLQDARRRESLAVYGSVVQAAFREVEVALAAETYLSEQARYLREANEQAAAAAEISSDRYDRGLDDIITLLAAQRSAFQAETDLIAIQRQQLDNRIDLLLALGGGFENEPDPDSQ